jgi:hypothetical protein
MCKSEKENKGDIGMEKSLNLSLIFSLAGWQGFTIDSSNGMKINIVDKAGRSSHSPPGYKDKNYRYWKPTNPGTSKIHTKFLDGDGRTALQFMSTAAHEFGHLIGLDDIVAGEKAPYDIMSWHKEDRKPENYKVLESNIKGAVKAYDTKIHQRYRR